MSRSDIWSGLYRVSLCLKKTQPFLFILVGESVYRSEDQHHGQLWQNDAALCWEKLGSGSSFSAMQQNIIRQGAALANYVHANMHSWRIGVTRMCFFFFIVYFEILIMCSVSGSNKLFKNTLLPLNWTSWIVLQVQETTQPHQPSTLAPYIVLKQGLRYKAVCLNRTYLTCLIYVINNLLGLFPLHFVVFCFYGKQSVYLFWFFKIWGLFLC